MRVEEVGEIDTLLARLRCEAAGRPVLLGVDAPIGLPDAYAARHLGGRSGFRAFLAGLRADDPFFAVCDAIEQVGGARPFFPRTVAGSPRRAAQAARLGVRHHDDLLRRCDRRTAARNRAACLFWTLGPNQVGKAALSLWRELLLPALQSADSPALWPFDGELPALLGAHAVTLAEAYPAEALSGLRPRWRGSKRRQADRAGLAGDVGGWSIGGIFRYSNGALIRIPGSVASGSNSLSSFLFRGTFAQRVPGQTYFTKNPNCHCFNPVTDTQLLNAGAWTEPGLGNFSPTAPYLNDFRWQRQPDEELNLGKRFAIPMGGKEPGSLQVRAEFFNVFNRVLYPQPSTSGYTGPYGAQGNFGRITYTNALGSAAYRTGQIVARFQF